MQNREQLIVGSRPAPGDLVFVQAFANMPFVVKDWNRLDKPKAFRMWLIRHGLMPANCRVSEADFKEAMAFRLALRSLLIANNGEPLEPVHIRTLSRIAADCQLRTDFLENGSAELRSSGRGIHRALGTLLAVVVRSMHDGSWYRLKACREPKCQWAFYDSSKNRSGRWCSMSVCGSRTKARAYRRRKSSKP